MGLGRGLHLVLKALPLQWLSALFVPLKFCCCHFHQVWLLLRMQRETHLELKKLWTEPEIDVTEKRKKISPNPKKNVMVLIYQSFHLVNTEETSKAKNNCMSA